MSLSAPPPPPRKSERPSQRPGGAVSLLGTTIGGRYRLDSVLGEGGMGTVYGAEHLLMRKRVALKVLHPDMSRQPDVVARFEREAMAAGHIDHPNIAAATDFGKLEDGSFFLVLELIVGDNLREVISRGPLPVHRALHIAKQITSALSRAHALGVVHRDVKADNVMLITRGADTDFVKILDFGIAKVPLMDQAAAPASSASPLSGPSSKVLTQMGMIYGTPDYMSPEQALGQPVDGRADLYAVGVVLFEMLTGKRPFYHENMATLLGMHVTAPVPAMSEVAPGVSVPAPVEAIVRRLLAKDPVGRFGTADELEAALDKSLDVTLPSEPLADGAVGPATGPIPTLSGAAKTGRGRTFIGVGAAAGLVAAVAAVFLTHSSPPAPVEAPVASASASATAVASAPPPLPPASASASPEPSATTSPQQDPLAVAIITADAALARNDAASVISAVAPLEAANGKHVEVHRVLERAYAMAHDRTAALREADFWLDLDPSAAADLGLQKDIGEMATRPAFSTAAIAVLAGKMGTPGVDILYDLGYASTQAPAVQRQARATLAQPSVRAHAGPAAAILLELRDATKCDAKKALLPRVRADADKRALPLLSPMTSGRGPYACMKGDGALAEAIAAVQSRSGRL